MKKQLMGAAVASIVTIGAIGTIGAIQIQNEETVTHISKVTNGIGLKEDSQYDAEKGITVGFDVDADGSLIDIDVSKVIPFEIFINETKLGLIDGDAINGVTTTFNGEDVTTTLGENNGGHMDKTWMGEIIPANFNDFGTNIFVVTVGIESNGETVNVDKTYDFIDNSSNTPIIPNDDSDGLSAGAIAGITIGSLAVVGLIAGGGYYFYTTKKSS